MKNTLDKLHKKERAKRNETIKFRSLGSKINLIIAAILIIAFGSIFTFISIKIYNIQIQHAEELAVSKNETFASNVHELYTRSLQTVQDFDNTLNGILNGSGEKNRDDIIQKLQKVLESNDQIFGMGVGFEPNAFDGKDNLYKNKPYHDATGRFIPYVSNANGILIEPLLDYDKEESTWYSIPKKTNKMIFTEPYTYEVNGKPYLLCTIALPIQDKAKTFIGVVTIDINITDLQEQAKAFNTDGGYACILSQAGTFAAHGTNPDLIMKNLIELDSQNSEVVAKIANGESFIKEEKSLVTGDISKKIYTPILFDGTDVKWSAVSVLSVKAIMGDFFKLLTLLIIIAVAALALVIAIIYFFMRANVSKPIQEILSATKKVANGELNAQISHQSKDELGQLSDGIKSIIETMQNIIGNIAQTLRQIAKGDLSVSIDMDYIGDFAQIKVSMAEITDSLNEVLSQINQSSSQVLSGAGQVASAANSLSQGATEQANSIEELSATIEDISSQIAKNAENAQSAKMIADHSSSTIEFANAKMLDMIAAMENINETSRKISKIIKTIDDIAFQTNILALNAAVEAARAGEAGKGFAVVADEVRNLASKSAEAAKDTTALIENSIQAVDKGTKIADETAKSLGSIVESAKRSADLVGEISDASVLQANAIMQTTQGVNQISGVVQTNSATAQESAAASEQLSSQADSLNRLVGNFKLRSVQSTAELELMPKSPVQAERENNKSSSKY